MVFVGGEILGPKAQNPHTDTDTPTHAVLDFLLVSLHGETQPSDGGFWPVCLNQTCSGHGGGIGEGAWVALAMPDHDMLPSKGATTFPVWTCFEVVLVGNAFPDHPNKTKWLYGHGSNSKSYLVNSPIQPLK